MIQSIICTVWEIFSIFLIYVLVLSQFIFLLHEELNFLKKEMKKHLYVPYDPKNVGCNIYKTGT